MTIYSKRHKITCAKLKHITGWLDSKIGCGHSEWRHEVGSGLSRGLWSRTRWACAAA